MVINLKNKLLQSGVTLIELLIAVAISSVLLLGVGSVYYNSKRTYMVQEEFAQLQEGARIAVNFLVEDIRIAGYMGCLENHNLSSPQNPKFESLLNSTGNASDDDAIDNYNLAVTGFEALASGPNTTVNLAAPTANHSGTVPTLNPAPNDGSDIIILRYAAGNGVRLTQNKNLGFFLIDNLGVPVIDNSSGTDCHIPTGICDGSHLLVTDCKKSRLFEATSLVVNGASIQVDHAGDGTPGNATIEWGGATDKSNDFEESDSFVYQAVSNAYYVANNPDGEPSLFRMSMRPGAIGQELITGVENMQILYGVDTEKTSAAARGDGIANTYVTAASVIPGNDNVVSIRFSLLLRTTNEVSTKSTAAPESKNYLLAGIDVASGTTIATIPDRRIRKVFTTTVKVRNKGLQ